MDKQKDPSVHLEETEEINYNYIIALIIVVFSIFIYFLYQRSKTVCRSILLMGLSDSGKTLLFSQIIHSRHVSTFTSIKENVGEYIVNNKVLRVVDIPGHERLRAKFFDQYKSSAKGIVYVIDSLTLQKEVKDVAEFLYVILTDSVINSSAPRILILCNKQDEMLSKGSSVIKSLIEKEMNTLRITQSNRLESVDSSKKKDIYLGSSNKDFDFLNVPPYTIEFAESQACDNTTDELKTWLAKLA